MEGENKCIYLHQHSIKKIKQHVLKGGERERERERDRLKASGGRREADVCLSVKKPFQLQPFHV